MGFEPWEGELPAFKDNKIYKINKNGVILEGEKFVFHSGKKRFKSCYGVCRISQWASYVRL